MTRYSCRSCHLDLIRINNNQSFTCRNCGPRFGDQVVMDETTMEEPEEIGAGHPSVASIGAGAGVWAVRASRHDHGHGHGRGHSYSHGHGHGHNHGPGHGHSHNFGQQPNPTADFITRIFQYRPPRSRHSSTSSLSSADGNGQHLQSPGPVRNRRNSGTRHNPMEHTGRASPAGPGPAPVKGQCQGQGQGHSLGGLRVVGVTVGFSSGDNVSSFGQGQSDIQNQGQGQCQGQIQSQGQEQQVTSLPKWPCMRREDAASQLAPIHSMNFLMQRLLTDMRNLGQLSPPLPLDLRLRLRWISLTQIQVDSNLGCAICLVCFELEDTCIQLCCGHVVHEICVLTFFNLCGNCPECYDDVAKGIESRREESEKNDDNDEYLGNGNGSLALA